MLSRTCASPVPLTVLITWKLREERSADSEWCTLISRILRAQSSFQYSNTSSINPIVFPSFLLSPVLILGNLQISCSILNTSVCKGLFFNDHGSWDKPFLSEMSAHEFLLQLILESRTQVAEEGFIWTVLIHEVPWPGRDTQFDCCN